jgi:hypothetical protein
MWASFSQSATVVGGEFVRCQVRFVWSGVDGGPRQPMHGMEQAVFGIVGQVVC